MAFEWEKGQDVMNQITGFKFNHYQLLYSNSNALPLNLDEMDCASDCENLKTLPLL